MFLGKEIISVLHSNKVPLIHRIVQICRMGHFTQKKIVALRKKTIYYLIDESHEFE